MLILYLAKFGIYGLSGKQSTWAEFGDYFGGVLNPILAFMAFIALLTTIELQSKELNQVVTEFKNSGEYQKKQAKSSYNFV